MSLRAIRKRENQSNISTGSRATLFKKATGSSAIKKPPATYQTNFKNTSTTLSSVRSLEQQRLLLGRHIHSNPEFRNTNETLESLALERLMHSKSENDVSQLLLNSSNTTKKTSGNVAGVHVGLLNAKSEVCLQTITSHSYSENNNLHQQQQTTNSSNSIKTARMFSNSHLQGDLSQSSYDTPARRRMSECSANSNYSQRTSVMSSSVLSNSSSTDTAPVATGILRVPIIGYEVMEERARFTVYKLRVENPQSNDCWLVLRRYTDFVRLNTKLKQAFPQIGLMLPRKKIFGDNFNSVFLDNRVQGLQMFVNSIMAKEELHRCKLVREFFCLDEPPTYSESMEECRAIFEAQEETIMHLKMQINNKNDLILSLQQKLREEMTEKEQLKHALNASLNCSHCAVSTAAVSASSDAGDANRS